MMNKKYSVLVYVKGPYKYSDKEEYMINLAKDEFGGRFVGGGTDLSNGMRDQQFCFKSIKDANAFVKHPYVKKITLKDKEILEIV